MSDEDKYDMVVDFIMQDNASAMDAFLRHAVELHYDINGVGICGATAVFQAAFHGHRRMLLLLLDSGADMNKQDFNGISPLMAAIENGHDDCAFLLLRRKASLNSARMSGVTCLQIAVLHAVHNGLVIALLHRGADVNQGDIMNFTPLMRSASNGDMTTARILVAAGADPNMENRCTGETAAQIATFCGHHELAKFLTHEGNWRRRRHLMMVFKSIAEVESDVRMYKVLLSRDMIGVIFSFL